MQFFNTYVSEKCYELVAETLRSTFLSEGRLVQQFESQLTRTLGLQHPVAVNSGTSALHLGLILAGVGPGDEVILPAQTFVATGLVILMQRAVPVFADIQYETGNLCPDSVGQTVTERTKAIMPVHWAGLPCDLSRLRAFGVPVVEDAAHALGATYQGQPVGSLSEFTAFSFQAIKHLTTGDGGALCCRSEEDYHRARKLRWFGIDRRFAEPSLLGERVYQLDTVGYKYHMNDLSAALGLGNLVDFPRNLGRRRAIAEAYRLGLAGTPGLCLLETKEDRESAYWLFTVHVQGRDDFVQALASRGVPTSVVNMGIDRHQVFGGARDQLPNQRRFDATQISLPVHEALSDDDVEHIIRSVKVGWG